MNRIDRHRNERHPLGAVVFRHHRREALSSPFGADGLGRRRERCRSAPFGPPAALLSVAKERSRPTPAQPGTTPGGRRVAFDIRESAGTPRRHEVASAFAAKRPERPAAANPHLPLLAGTKSGSALERILSSYATGKPHSRCGTGRLTDLAAMLSGRRWWMPRP